MRTADSCPICTTYIDASCIIYNGLYLSTIDVEPKDSLEEALGKINAALSTLQPSLGFTPENVANKSPDNTLGGVAPSDTLYPTQRAVKDYIFNNISSLTWSLNGNGGTDPLVNFLGTTDLKDLVFKVNNTEYLRFNSVTGNNNEVSFSQNIKLSRTSSQIWVAETTNNGYVTINADAADRGKITLAKDLTNTSTIKCSNITGTKTLQLPDANGTLVATVNGTAPDAQGNVTVAVSAPYTVYTALLDAGIPSATVLQNTTGLTITWSNPANGVLRGTFSSFLTNLDKVWVSTPSFRQGGDLYFVNMELTFTRVDVLFTLYDNTRAFTPAITRHPIELRIYP